MVMSASSLATGRQLAILIASDRETLTRSVAEALRSQGHYPIIQETPAGAADALAAPGVDVLMLDSDFPGIDWSQVRAALTPDRPSLPESLDAVERRHIAATLRYTRGNRRNAAQLLGIARSTLLAKIRKYGLE